jgi:hypothetical protein
MRRREVKFNIQHSGTATDAPYQVQENVLINALEFACDFPRTKELHVNLPFFKRCTINKMAQRKQQSFKPAGSPDKS